MKDGINNSFYIEFDTKEYEPFLKAVRVQLDAEMIRDLNKQLPVNLSDHPLYPALVRYVLNNPIKKKESSNAS